MKKIEGYAVFAKVEGKWVMQFPVFSNASSALNDMEEYIDKFEYGVFPLFSEISEISETERDSAEGAERP